MTDWIAQLCQHVGVASDYRGFDGQTVRVTRDTCVAVLGAMALDAGSETRAHETLREMQADEDRRPAPREVIVRAGHAADIPTSQAADWTLEAGRTGEALARGKAQDHVSLPALPIGIHRLRLRAQSQDFTTWVLATPPRAFGLRDRVDDPRIWGVSGALYGLTDGKTAPMGTYDLLGAYAAAMAGHGPDFLGINPIHAMGQVRPGDVISPYSPSHREFLNTWHCSGFETAGPNTSELIDYPSALHGNDRALSDQFAAFCRLPASAPDRQAFEAFVQAKGACLRAYALFEALAERFGPDWRDWPAIYRDHDSGALAAFEQANAPAISRTEWAQWQAECQLSRAQSRAIDAGMRLGLYLDLAVGPRLGGAETWASDNALVTGATLGAPPDPLGPAGQCWGLAPQSPLKLRDQGYAGFARLLAANMRHAGMIRIDHVLGLMRSFWIPKGSTEGTYVTYPFDALLAVVAIESVLNECIVVGEDLGLVPQDFSKKLATAGIYGLDVLQYMRSPTDGFTNTADTRELAVCAFATHDTPTIAGFFAAEDAQVRARLGTIDGATFDQVRADRQAAQDTLGGVEPVREIHRRLARAGSAMVAVQLDDIAERKAQQNVPGTVDEYSNWRLKAPFTVDEVASSDAFAQIGSEMRAQGRTNRNRMELEDDRQDCSNLAD